ncbi:hypothetical protein EG346_14070 [Chryseobacterium carnipullorum]|uniref:Uncharacterized protein n=1 Tax=Chryseobacterium carnipullorum TaxID=1124835 RepID=A0A376DQW5_CHRCU|nr:hypothetical protein EG346_14070 [Chryseobacterium carnipullorum]AZA64126.1 hypothetical protein EG345_05005 [Chryseobacterium carnipullorum]STC94046.1 Uncharacterised protein [Chryseobacterium carnipullorum]
MKTYSVVQNSILDILKLKTTEISVTVDDSSITTKIIDRGILIYKIKEKNKYHPFINSLQINLYFLNRSAKINFKNKMGICTSSNQLRHFSLNP